jgi:hypothetical protein
VVTAVELLGLTPALKLQRILEGVKKRVSPLLEDRYFGPEISLAGEMVL